MKTGPSRRKKSIYSRIVPAVMLLFLMSTAAFVGEAAARELRYRQIIDQAVMNPDGKQIAEIDDLIIRRHGKVKKAVLSLGGFLGIGDKEVTVRFGALQIKDAGKIVCNTTQQQLEKQPSFDAFKQKVALGYYYHPYRLETPPRAAGRRNAPYPRGAARDRYYDPSYETPYAPYHYPHFYPPGLPARGYYPRAYHPWQWAYFPRRMLGSFIIGRVVINKQGEEVASVEDLIIDQNHNVEKIILSAGGFLDIGDKLVAVPFRPLGITDYGITYDITGEELEELPAVQYEK